MAKFIFFSLSKSLNSMFHLPFLTRMFFSGMISFANYFSYFLGPQGCEINFLKNVPNVATFSKNNSETVINLLIAPRRPEMKVG